MGLGAFTLAHVSGHGYNLDVQQFQCPAKGNWKGASGVAASALKYNGVHLLFDTDGDATVTYSDGCVCRKQVTYEHVSYNLDGVMTLSREKPSKFWKWVVSFGAGGHFSAHHRYHNKFNSGNMYNVWLSLPLSIQLQTTGLCEKPCTMQDAIVAEAACENSACMQVPPEENLFPEELVEVLNEKCNVPAIPPNDCKDVAPDADAACGEQTWDRVDPYTACLNKYEFPTSDLQYSTDPNFQWLSWATGCNHASRMESRRRELQAQSETNLDASWMESNAKAQCRPGNDQVSGRGSVAAVTHPISPAPRIVARMAAKTTAASRAGTFVRPLSRPISSSGRRSAAGT